MSREHLGEGEPEPEFGGFDFSSFDQPKVEVQQIGIREMIEALDKRRKEVQNNARHFEINAEGTVTAHGYSPDEVRQLMSDWREHMADFGRKMQALQTASDAMHHPGGYE